MPIYVRDIDVLMRMFWIVSSYDFLGAEVLNDLLDPGHQFLTILNF